MSESVKCYEIGGVRIRLKADFPIDAGHYFPLFESGFETADAEQEFISADNLEFPEGIPAKRVGMRRIYERENEMLIAYRSVYSEEVCDAIVYMRPSKCTVKTYVSSSFSQEHEGKLYVHQFSEIPHLMLVAGTAILHSSFIVHEGKAILFTADSGVGKSTQAELWRKKMGADIINGDRAAIRMENGAAYAGGVPYCGCSRICERGEYPIRAIVTLSQEKENTAQRLSPMQAVPKLFKQLTVHSYLREDIERAMRIVCEVAEKVPIVHLGCTPDERAVEILLRAI